MAKISEKPVKSPTREANQKDVKVVKEEKKNVKKWVKEEIMEDVKRVSMAHLEYGLADKLSVEEIEAILNNYL